MRTWYFSPTVLVIFDFFHQYLIVFCIQVFCILTALILIRTVMEAARERVGIGTL